MINNIDIQKAACVNKERKVFLRGIFQAFKRQPTHQLKCDICEKRFAHRRSLMKHLRLLHPEEKRFQCDTCRKKFAQYPTLWMHKMLHSLEKRHECTICTKSFAQPTQLYVHRIEVQGWLVYEQLRQMGIPGCRVQKSFTL